MILGDESGLGNAHNEMERRYILDRQLPHSTASYSEIARSRSNTPLGQEESRSGSRSRLNRTEAKISWQDEEQETRSSNHPTSELRRARFQQVRRERLAALNREVGDEQNSDFPPHTVILLS